MNMELFIQYITYAFMVIGGLAFLTSVIVQAIKELPWLLKVQTSVIELVVSVLVCTLAMVVACQYFGLVIFWYYWPGAIIAAFVVYLVATGGWERVTGIWERTKYNRK